MDDKELLELAAKALRIKPDEFATDGTAFFGKSRWNPLTDDGDAFRLAVTIGISIKLSIDIVTLSWRDEWGNLDCLSTVVTEDRTGTVRRAIVRFAADIGSRLP